MSVNRATVRYIIVPRWIYLSYRGRTRRVSDHALSEGGPGRKTHRPLVRPDLHGRVGRRSAPRPRDDDGPGRRRDARLRAVRRFETFVDGLTRERNGAPPRVASGPTRSRTATCCTRRWRRRPTPATPGSSSVSAGRRCSRRAASRSTGPHEPPLPGRAGGHVPAARPVRRADPRHPRGERARETVQDRLEPDDGGRPHADLSDWSVEDDREWRQYRFSRDESVFPDGCRQPSRPG